MKAQQLNRKTFIKQFLTLVSGIFILPKMNKADDRPSKASSPRIANVLKDPRAVSR